MERPDSRGENELTDRYEFIGKIADDKVRRKYVDKSVAFFSPKGMPIQLNTCWEKTVKYGKYH